MGIQKDSKIEAKDWNSRSISYSRILTASHRNTIGSINDKTDTVYFWIRNGSAFGEDDFTAHEFDGIAQPEGTTVLYKGLKYVTLNNITTIAPSNSPASSDSNYTLVGFSNFWCSLEDAWSGYSLNLKVYPYADTDWGTAIIDRDAPYSGASTKEYTLFPGYYKAVAFFDDPSSGTFGTKDAKAKISIKKGSTRVFPGKMLRSFDADYSDLASKYSYGPVIASTAIETNTLTDSGIGKIGGTIGEYTGVY